MTITLATQQIEAFDKIMHWFNNTDEKAFVLGGYAGTGKTTLAKQIANEVDSTLFLAYTGKAAHVLRNKGCEPAGTIHSALYQLIGINKDTGEMEWGTRDEVNMSKYSLTIIDEFSMLSEKIVSDLMLSNANRLLFLGDLYQLPPVNGVCPLTPDFTLTEIHRQALESPILRAATKVRTGGMLNFCDEGDFSFVPMQKTDRHTYLNADQVLCGKNATRYKFNAKFRQFLGFSGTFPQCGEKLICLKNNVNDKVFNGMIGAAMADWREGLSATGHLDFTVDGRDYNDLVVWQGDFKQEKAPPDLPYPWNRFDFGYTITVHKSQGSEFSDVVLLNEPIGRGEDARKWVYTGLTRAVNRLVMVQP